MVPKSERPKLSTTTLTVWPPRVAIVPWGLSVTHGEPAYLAALGGGLAPVNSPADLETWAASSQAQVSQPNRSHRELWLLKPII